MAVEQFAAIDPFPRCTQPGPALPEGARAGGVTRFAIPEREIEISAVRAQGAGGQNVNKVSNAVHLRFDIRASSLPEEVKLRLLHRGDRRITSEGVVVIKAQQHRKLELNRAEAIGRLHALVESAAHVPKARRPTRPSRAARARRVEAKQRRASLKAQRGRVRDW